MMIGQVVGEELIPSRFIVFVRYRLVRYRLVRYRLVRCRLVRYKLVRYRLDRCRLVRYNRSLSGICPSELLLSLL